MTINGEHRYVEFSCMSQTDLKPHVISNPEGLSGWQVISHLMDVWHQYPGHIVIIYGGSYDWNLWLKTMRLNDESLRRVYKGNFLMVGGYRIRWMKGKTFYVSHVGSGRKFTIYDVVSFFQTTFVKACDSYLGDKFVDRDRIVENKAKRGSFTLDELQSVTDYNNSELINLILLMDELRARLNRVGLYPSRWDGPGAIAAFLLQRQGIKKAMRTSPPAVAQAARYAYAGGRFEVIKFGDYRRQCYEYDVNSAYPTALRNVPDLTRGKWVHSDGSAGIKDFALYHIQWDIPNPSIPGPLFRRMKDGTVHYPMRGTGWYWSPEYNACLRYAKAIPGAQFTVLETWHFEARGDSKPFGFIDPLYKERQKLKAINDGGHVGIKLALNSLYGKLAQQVGWRKIGDELRLPPFHQIEWAGYVTSYCRAMVLTAALKNPSAVIAFETDALFTDAPLEGIDVGPNLGQFEELRFRNLTYLQSGMYYAQDMNGEEKTAKTRGIDRGKLSRADCLKLLKEKDSEKRKVKVTLVRFMTLGVGLMQGLHKWCQWMPLEKNVSIEPTGKRVHSPLCPNCGSGGLRSGWHVTMCPTLKDEHSYEFPVEWINPNPEMDVLGELRDMPNEWEPLTLFDE